MTGRRQARAAARNRANAIELGRKVAARRAAAAVEVGPADVARDASDRRDAAEAAATADSCLACGGDLCTADWCINPELARA